MSLSSVKLGTSFNKKYTHNLDFDNNTTMDFGSVQPLLCHYLLPKSDVNLNYRQLIRLAPMPTPSFARIFAKNYARFVPMTDVVEYHEAFLSKKPYYSKDRSFIPATMPFTENRVLQYMLLWLSQWSVCLAVDGEPTHYAVYNTGSNYESDYNTLMRSFYAFIGLGSQPLRPLQQSLYKPNLYCVPFEESDYIVPVYNNAGATLVCAKHLAPKNITKVGICGTGTQAHAILSMTPYVLGKQKVVVYGYTKELTDAFVAEFKEKGFDIEPAYDVKTVCDQCNYIVTATTTMTPLITADMIKPGTHITGVGADAGGKNEIDASVFAVADLVVNDSKSQCTVDGDTGAIKEGAIIELGTLIHVGKGRENDDQITVADLTGIAVQDIIAAEMACRLLGE